MLFEPILTWAVLAPAPADALMPPVDRAWTDRYGDEEELERWTIQSGTGTYSAVVCRIPGTEGDDETLAQQLSAALNGEVYALRFLEGAEIVWVYAGGSFVREDARGPGVVAAALGCTVEPAAPSATPLTRGLCVVEGAALPDVDRVLRLHVGNAPIRAIANKLGAIVYSEKGNAGVWNSTLASELPVATVYAVVTGPARGQLSVIVSRGDDTVGSLDIGGPADPNYEQLHDIKGATRADAVLTALDIPPALMVIT